MRLAVIIPTLGRPGIVADLLDHLRGQTRAPDAVVVSAPSLDHVPGHAAVNYELSIVVGGEGLCAQRNRALERVLPWVDIVTFFDDDFLPADNYLARLVHWFESMPHVAAIMGHAAVDGARGPGLTFEEGRMALRALEAGTPPDGGPTDQVGTYGCNMSIRASLIGDMRFDERLALYGWQEDIDFTGRLRPYGRVVQVPELIGVHLGFKAGRVSGVRFGYSQMVNPTYLIRKGSIPAKFGVSLMARNVAANLLKSLLPTSDIDRRGRLKGNLIGAFHLATGRVEPEFILRL